MKDEPEYHETWKVIAHAVGRSERWCRYTAVKATDPLPVFKMGGIVRLNVADFEAWVERQRGRGLPKLEAAPVRTKACGLCGTMVTDEVWATARLGPRQMACLHCLAERLGRPLRSKDFTDAAVNREIVAVLEANEAAERKRTLVEARPCVDCRRVHSASDGCRARDDDGYF